MPEATAAKVCTVCGVDCSNRPRVKDQQGRYMCQDCFDRVKATKQVQKAPATPASKPAEPAAPAGAAVNLNDNSFLLDLGQKPAASGKARACPECGRAITEGTVICIGCGFNLQTGKRLSVKVERAKQVKVKSTGGGGGFDLAAAGGGTVFMLVLALYGAALGGAVAAPDLAGACVMLCGLLSLAIGIWTLIEALKESWIWGLGSLFVPLVGLVFVIFFCEDERVKGAYFAMVLGYVALGAMMASGQIAMQPV